jgi:hypothetical protein
MSRDLQAHKVSVAIKVLMDYLVQMVAQALMDYPVQLDQLEQRVQQVAVQLVRKDQLEQRVQQVAVLQVRKDRRVQLVRKVCAVKLEQLELRVIVVRREQLDRLKSLMFLSPLGHYKQQPCMDLQLQLVSEHLKLGIHINFRFSSGGQRIVLMPLMGWSC